MSGREFFENIPSEIQAEIFGRLPPAEIIENIQAFQSLQDKLPGWNFALLTAESLVSLHEFLETSSFSTPMVDYLRGKIIKTLPKAFEGFLENVSNGYHLEPNFFNCYFDDINTTMSEISECETEKLRDEAVTRFLTKYKYRNEIVREFCNEVTKADPNGRVCRYGKVIPNEKTWFIHLLFWLATDYVRKHRGDSGLLNEETIASHWEDFFYQVDILFGPEIKDSLKDCVLQEGIILLKYHDYVGGCSTSRLPKIFDCLKPLALKSQYVTFEDYATFMLVHGLDRAYKFLKEDSQAINFIAQPRNGGEIVAWRNLWSNFGITEDAAGEAYR